MHYSRWMKVIGLIWDIFFKEILCSFVIEQSLFMSRLQKRSCRGQDRMSLIYNYLCIHPLSSLTLWFWIPPRLCVLETCFTVHNTVHIYCHMYDMYFLLIVACTFSFGHCFVWSPLIYEFGLPLWYLQTPVSSINERLWPQTSFKYSILGHPNT